MLVRALGYPWRHLLVRLARPRSEAAMIEALIGLLRSPFIDFALAVMAGAVYFDSRRQQ